MSNPPKPVVDVRTRRSTSGRPSLVLEGKDDFDVYSRWLAKLLGPGAVVSSQVDLISVGGKMNVLTVLEWFRDREGNPSDLLGIVDRDEWDDATIAARMTSLTQLRVNALRHGLESYFCDPSEITPALLAEDAVTLGPRIAALEAQVNAALSDRVDHWSLFTLTERLKNRMIEAEYPGVFHALYVLPDDPTIETRLQVWTGIMNSVEAMKEFLHLRTGGRTSPRTAQLRSAVWPKPFFEQVVYGDASGLQAMRAKAIGTWMIDLAENAPSVPPDIEPILRELLP